MHHTFFCPCPLLRFKGFQAYAAALARQTLGRLPRKVDVLVSSNIIKNVKSVIVPHTGGLRGVASAVAAGIAAGDESYHLYLYLMMERLAEETEQGGYR